LGGGGAGGRNAEKVILGAKTPHPWCTTTFKGVTKNHAFYISNNPQFGEIKSTSVIRK
jgi:hypothetical protein